MRALIKKFFRGNMFGGVKITLIICLTIITSCVLFISYNEYSERYSIVSTSDNGIYIFDKKSTVLNRCDGKNCFVIETKLPTKTILNQDTGFQQSKLFESEKPMVTATLDNSNINSDSKIINSNNNNDNESKENKLSNPESSNTNSQTTEKIEKSSSDTKSTTSDSKEEKTPTQNEDEFIE